MESGNIYANHSIQFIITGNETYPARGSGWN